jgi:hypothetical protein
MVIGKSINIHLLDGTVTGIKCAEVRNQTILSFSCPRNKIAELSNNPNSKKPGIYFLFGNDEESNEPKAYIGEAENVFERLQNHLLSKGFWDEVIFFVSKDENLTKSHVRFLESKTIQIAYSTNRYLIDNANESKLPSLPLAERDAMEEFLIYLKLLLGILGHKLLEEKIPAIITKKESKNTPKKEAKQSLLPEDNYLKLTLNFGFCKANAIVTDEGIVVLKDSEVSKDIHKSLRIGYQDLRQKLISSSRELV